MRVVPPDDLRVGAPSSFERQGIPLSVTYQSAHKVLGLRRAGQHLDDVAQRLGAWRRSRRLEPLSAVQPIRPPVKTIRPSAAMPLA
jgi:hypothetical protein